MSDQAEAARPAVTCPRCSSQRIIVGFYDGELDCRACGMGWETPIAAPETSIVVEVCQRPGETCDGKPTFHAQLKGHPEIWGAGRSPEQAIGSVIWSHAETFGLKVVDLGRLAR